MNLIGKALLGAAAVTLFVWYLSRLGVGNVWAAVAGIGPCAPLVLVPYFVVYLVDCLAWAKTLPPHSLAFFTLFRIRWAGESVNNIIPSAYIGGEAVKVVMLREKGISASQGATSAVVSKTAQSLAQLIFIILASAVLFFLAHDRPEVRVGVVFVVLGGLATMTLLFWSQRIGLFRMLTSVLSVLPLTIGPLERRKEKLRDLDRMILSFYRENPRRFHASTLLYLGGWMLDTVEIFLVAHLLEMPVSWSQALVVEAFAGVAKALGMWIPGSLGVQESGIVLMGRIAGLPDTLSAAYALIRRARELVFAGIGLLLVRRPPRIAQ